MSSHCRFDDGKVCETLKCGGDVWWTGELMMEQLTSKTIQVPVFKRNFPGCQALFAFDNAKGHQKYATNALCTDNINLTPGGKNTVSMWDGWFVQSDKPGEIQKQSIILPDGCLKRLALFYKKEDFGQLDVGFLPNVQFLVRVLELLSLILLANM